MTAYLITLFRMVLLPQVPQLIRSEIALSWKRMVVPSISEYVEVGLEPWDDGIVTAKDVQTARQIKMSILFQLVQDMVEMGGNSSEHITPQSLYPVLSKE